jgi:hypothetical protein
MTSICTANLFLSRTLPLRPLAQKRNSKCFPNLKHRLIAKDSFNMRRYLTHLRPLRSAAQHHALFVSALRNTSSAAGGTTHQGGTHHVTHIGVQAEAFEAGVAAHREVTGASAGADDQNETNVQSSRVIHFIADLLYCAARYGKLGPEVTDEGETQGALSGCYLAKDVQICMIVLSSCFSHDIFRHYTSR